MEDQKNDFLKIELKENNILLFTTLKSCVSEEEWDDCQKMVNKYYLYAKENNIMFGLIIDISSITYLKTKFFINWKKQYLLNKDNTEKYVFGSCVKINNFIIRRFINSFFSYYKLSKPFSVVKTIDDGYLFLNPINIIKI